MLRSVAKPLLNDAFGGGFSAVHPFMQSKANSSARVLIHMIVAQEDMSIVI